MGESPHCMSWLASLARLSGTSRGHSQAIAPLRGLNWRAQDSRLGEGEGLDKGQAGSPRCACVPPAAPLRPSQFHKPLPVPWLTHGFDLEP